MPGFAAKPRSTCASGNSHRSRARSLRRHTGADEQGAEIGVRLQRIQLRVDRQKHYRVRPLLQGASEQRQRFGALTEREMELHGTALRLRRLTA